MVRKEARLSLTVVIYMLNSHPVWFLSTADNAGRKQRHEQVHLFNVGVLDVPIQKEADALNRKKLCGARRCAIANFTSRIILSILT